MMQILSIYNRPKIYHRNLLNAVKQSLKISSKSVMSYHIVYWLWW